MELYAVTTARVDLTTPNNVTWQDAFQFGTPGDTTWSLTGQSFRMDIKGDSQDAAALLSLTSAGGTIVVDDVVQRIVHLNVPEATIQASLPPGNYVYDFIMFDASVPPVRVQLMRGCVNVTLGITGG